MSGTEIVGCTLHNRVKTNLDATKAHARGRGSGVRSPWGQELHIKFAVIRGGPVGRNQAGKRI